MNYVQVPSIQTDFLCSRNNKIGSKQDSISHYTRQSGEVVICRVEDMSSANQTLPPRVSNLEKVRTKVRGPVEIISGRYGKVAHQLISEMAESPKLCYVLSWQVLGSWPSCLRLVFQPSFLFYDVSFQDIPFLLR